MKNILYVSHRPYTPLQKILAMEQDSIYDKRNYTIGLRDFHDLC